jgi:precorrin-3B C17-methyltransferase
VTGWLRVLGLGPGPERWITPEVSEVIAASSDIVGYHVYVARLTAADDQRVHRSDNGDELKRAEHALQLAAGGAKVALVSGGDPGVFAMAAAVFEALEHGPVAWRELDVAVLPGVTAMLAAAARLGAPLGNDFCAINLSDNLKPWAVIAKRLSLAAQADFVIALYNPASRARPGQVHDAFAILQAELPEATIVVFARAIGRTDEALHVTTLGKADPAMADMRTVILVGSQTTRLLERPNAGPWVYSPRRLEAEP